MSSHVCSLWPSRRRQLASLLTVVTLAVLGAVLYSNTPDSFTLERYGLVELPQYQRKRMNLVSNPLVVSQSGALGTVVPTAGAVSFCVPESTNTRDCLTNDPFREPLVQVSSPLLQLASNQQNSCSDRVCSHFLSTENNTNRCWLRKTKKLMDQVRCEFMNATGRPPVALVSFPGSGNTWVRGLLEQVTGYCTGSVYCDQGLARTGFVGEGVQSGAVLVVKTHHNSPFHPAHPERPRYGGAVLLVRNLFDALKAEMNRAVFDKRHPGSDSWRSHVTHGGSRIFGKNEMWKRFVHEKALDWLMMMRNWTVENHGTPVLVVHYEDLLVSPVREIKKILRFLNVEYGVGEVEEPLQQDFTAFHRPPHTQNKDVYTEELQSFVNSVVSDAEAFVSDNGLVDIINVTVYHR